jgi:hypothetical protein
MDTQHRVKDKLQEHIIAEKTNKQTKMVGNDTTEQKTLGLRRMPKKMAVLRGAFLLNIWSKRFLRCSSIFHSMGTGTT